MKLPIYTFCLLWVSLFLLEPNQSFAQSTPADSTEITIPQAWVGTWKGTLKLASASGKKTNIPTEIPMELHIYPIADSKRWQWTIIYNEKDVRRYELLATNSQKGQYQIDEKNSILLDASYFHGTLLSYFAIQTSFVFITYQHQTASDEMLIEIYAGNSDNVKETGGEGDVPIVYVFPMSGMQQAILKRHVD